MIRYVLSIILLFHCLSLSAVDKRASIDWRREHKQMTALLSLDRFLYYRQAWVDNFAGKKSEAIVQRVKDISAKELHARLPELESLFADPKSYDSLLLRLVNANSKFAKLSSTDLAWNYNFFKNKLAESFILVDRPNVGEIPGFSELLPLYTTQVSIESPEQWRPDGPVLLDTDQYISNRNTRAVFWDAELNNRKLEFHMGTERAFRTRLNARGGIILAEVKPLARNYNKMYVVKYPNDPALHYAFTRISGSDRLDHLIKQQVLTELGMRGAKAPTKVYGSSKNLEENIERGLRQFLERLPHADLVIIGQKGSIEGIMRSAYLAEGLEALLKQNANLVESKLGAQDFLELNNLVKSMGSKKLTDLNRLKKIDKFTKLLKVELEAEVGFVAGLEKAFDVRNVSHDIADYVLRGTAGGVRRWRVISNVWGDEVLPIANALRSTGHKSVVSIGTAGAINEKGFKVGNLLEVTDLYLGPKSEVQSVGGAQTFKIAEAKPVTVGHVTTPFMETTEWFKSNRDKIDAIELETAYLNSVFLGYGNYQSFLLVSDIVGAKHESLAAAASGDRKRSLNLLLAGIIRKENVISVLPRDQVDGQVPSQRQLLAKIVNQLAPRRSAESRYQVTQLAYKSDLGSSAQISSIIEAERPFTNQLLVKALNRNGQILAAIDEAVTEKNVSLRMYLAEDFMGGYWNPNKKLRVLLQVPSSSDLSLVNSVVAATLNLDKGFKGAIEFVTIDREPSAEWLKGIVLSAGSSHFLTDLYSDIAIREGGLYSSVNTVGNMIYTEVGDMVGQAGDCESMLMKASGE